MNHICCLVLGAALSVTTLHVADPLPIPEEAAQAKAEKLVRDLFKEEYAKKKAVDLADLARKLLKVASGTANDSTARFVMYREARDLAARAGIMDVALEAIDSVSKEFAVNVVQFKTAALEIAEKAPQSGAQELTEIALAVSDDALRGDDYLAAARLLALAGRTASRAKIPALGDLVANRGKELESIRKAYEATESDRKTLRTKPDDPEAAGRVGRFVCLVKGDWELGLPFLAKGEDAKLKGLAESDLANPKAATARLDCADGWWALGETLEGAERMEARLRARYWYAQAAPELTGLMKALAEKRLQETAQLAEQRLNRGTIGGWIVLFRSSDPSLWNTKTNRGRNQFALPLTRTPAGIHHLRLTDMTKGNFVIIEMTKERLGEQSEVSGYGWIGTNVQDFKAYHLGIYDTAWKDCPKGSISVYHPGGFDNFRGWGFGHRSFMDDQQGYTWAGAPAATTVFEIAVKVGPLTPEETKRLLVKKKK